MNTYHKQCLEIAYSKPEIDRIVFNTKNYIGQKCDPDTIPMPTPMVLHLLATIEKGCRCD